MFGFASTVLLVGIWGRAVVVDTEELAESSVADGSQRGRSWTGSRPGWSTSWERSDSTR